jgi:hypothetical protein
MSATAEDITAPLPRRGRGRPRLDDPRPPTGRLACRVPVTLQQRIDELAEKLGNNRSSMMCRLLAIGVEALESKS